MEMLILAIIFAKVSMDATRKLVVDGAYAVRGKESPRYQKAQQRTWRPHKPSGAATRYFAQLWEDGWTSQLQRHTKRRDRRAARPDKPSGAARTFLAREMRDARKAAGRRWDHGWMHLDERRRERAFRDAPGQQTVPGAVINTDPDPSPGPVPTPAGTGRDRPADPVPDAGTGPEPTGTGTSKPGGPGPAVPEPARDRLTPQPIDPNPSTGRTATDEGKPTIMTNPMPTGEVTSLSAAINWCQKNAEGVGALLPAFETVNSSLRAGDYTGPAVQHLATAREAVTTAQRALASAHDELTKDLTIKDAFGARPGAGSKEFITGG